MILVEVAISACLLLNINPSVARKCENIVKKRCFTQAQERSYRDCYIKVAPEINVLMKRQYAKTLILGEDDVNNKPKPTTEAKKPETKPVETKPATETKEPSTEAAGATGVGAAAQASTETAKKDEATSVNDGIVPTPDSLAMVELLLKDLPSYLNLEVENVEHQREIDIALQSVKHGANKIESALTFIKSALTKVD